MTRSEASLIVARLVEAYPVPAWTDAAADLWVEMISDLDRDVTAKVVWDLIATRTHRPAIADIRGGVASASADDLVYLPPDEAWGVVQKAIGSVGRYHEFPTTYPLVAHAVNMIGWESICDSVSIEITRAQFRSAYTALLERAKTRAAVSPGATAAPRLSHSREPLVAIESIAQLVGAIGGKR